MIIKTRPHQIFNLIAAKQRLVSICLPEKPSVTTMLERGQLAALLNEINPFKIFEFGTVFGETTLMLAEDSQGQVTTFDLVASHDSGILDGFERKNLAGHRSTTKRFEGHPAQQRVAQVYGDSTLVDLTAHCTSMQFILIDGEHQLEVVKKDTEYAFMVLDEDHPSCTVWHDCLNPHCQITKLPAELSSGLPLPHLQETKDVVF